jgi:triosephosphate isomerase
MRKQIAAANWKMNLTWQAGEKLIAETLSAGIQVPGGRGVILAVPFPYLSLAERAIQGRENYHISAQNCYQKVSGAYTGEVSAEMLQSLGIRYCILGHSERREYFRETGRELAERINICLDRGIRPIFCCGEPLPVREADKQDGYVEAQLRESIFHLSGEQLEQLIIAYEPIWAIGTGKTASTAEAQQMHAHLRTLLQSHWGEAVAEKIPILYGGSVKAGNARELFACPDVDGGLVGGASLIAQDFIQIIQALK